MALALMAVYERPTGSPGQRAVAEKFNDYRRWRNKSLPSGSSSASAKSGLSAYLMRRLRIAVYKDILDAIVMKARQDRHFDLESLTIKANAHAVLISVKGGSRLCAGDVLGSVDVTPMDEAVFDALAVRVDIVYEQLESKGIGSPMPDTVGDTVDLRRWVRFFCALLHVATVESKGKDVTVKELSRALAHTEIHKATLTRLAAVTGESSDAL